MAIVAGNLIYLLSGGASNAVPDDALGGVISTNEVVDATIHNLFDLVNSEEAASGEVSYRCIYVKNTHSTLTLLSSYVYIDTNTPNTDTEIGIGLGSSAINATEQTIVNKTTAPSAITFTELTGVGNKIVIGDLLPSETKAIWVRRTVNAGAGAATADSATIKFGGGTLA